MTKENQKNDAQQDIIRTVGLMSKGFGFAPKLVMQDTKLSIEAKAIYNYFSSYAGSGDSAFPKVDTILYHLQISQSRYYRHFKQLVDNGYITVEQVKNKGKFSHNVYTLVQTFRVAANEEKEQVEPIPQNECTVELEEKPSTQNECTENPSTEKPDTENEGTNINNPIINTFNSNSVNNSSIYQSIKNIKSHTTDTGMVEGRNEEELQYFFKNMEIEKLDEDQETIEALKQVISHMYYSKELKVGKSIVGPGIIKSVISKLNILHLQNALRSFNEASKEKEIRNPLAYMCSTIYTAVINNKFGMQAKANYDLYNEDAVNS